MNKFTNWLDKQRMKKRVSALPQYPQKDETVKEVTASKDRKTMLVVKYSLNPKIEPSYHTEGKLSDGSLFEMAEGTYLGEVSRVRDSYRKVSGCFDQVTKDVAKSQSTFSEDLFNGVSQGLKLTQVEGGYKALIDGEDTQISEDTQEYLAKLFPKAKSFYIRYSRVNEKGDSTFLRKKSDLTDRIKLNVGIIYQN